MKLSSLVLVLLLAAVAFPQGESDSKPFNPRKVDSAKSDKAQFESGKPAAGKSTPGKRPTESMTVNQNKSPSYSSDDESTLLTIIEEVEVPAKVEGVLSKIAVHEGQLVDEGAVLARIDDAEVRLTYDRATIEYEIASKQAKNELKIRIAKKAAAYARSELKRSLDSNAIKRDTVSESELDRQRLAADKGDLEVEQAQIDRETAELTSQLKETEMKLAQQAIERRAIVSTISGMVVQVNAHAGEWVPAGKTVFRVVRLDRLRVESFVHAKQLKPDLDGRKVTLAVDLAGKPGAEFPGTIVFVSPEVDPVNQTVRVWAEIDNPQLLLRPGLRGKLTIHSLDPKEARREGTK
jgi:macrolide-specific efflux system membrane fusion protein